MARWLALSVTSAVLAFSGHARGAQDLPKGQIIDSVTCLNDQTQSYSLYLPTGYTPQRPAPLLLGFHPGARGRAIVEKYRDVAEQYGYIVAGSNNSRNGSWDVAARAAQAMSQDLGSRFAIEPARIYATGHSGGARVAMQLALASKAIAGVIASSAAYPDDHPRSSLRFPVFGTAGDADFNYIEMRLLDRTLKSPHRVVIFEGGHTLPPDDVARQAIEWMELQAMKSGLRMRDDAMIDRWLEERRSSAAAAGETARAVQRFREIAEDFAGVRDVKFAEDRAGGLARQPAIKQALERERDDVTAEARLLDRFSSLEMGLRDEQARGDSLVSLRVLLEDLSKKAAAGDDSPARDRSRRVLRIVTMGAAERVQDAEYLKLLQRYRPTGR